METMETMETIMPSMQIIMLMNLTRTLKVVLHVKVMMPMSASLLQLLLARNVLTR